MSQEKIKRVLVLHAYSSRNRGDGLLVDETIELIREAYGPQAEIRVLAMDADSFSDRRGYEVIQLPITSPGAASKIRALWQIIFSPGTLGFGHRELEHWIDESPSQSVIVAVGGGYMRSTNLVQSIKFFLAHGLQLRFAGRRHCRSVYLSQSVGPFRCAVGRWLQKAAPQVTTLVARDDRSVQELGRPASVVRLPDLAVLRISQSLVSAVPRSVSQAQIRRFVLVLRDLEGDVARREKYYKLCRGLIAKLGQDRVVLAIQSVGRGNDDAAFYQRMNFGPQVLPIDAALETYKDAVVVSVRLHGALQSIISGFPTVHLSYERKGFGAYEDLGIKGLVHNAFDFDVEVVAQQAEELSAHPHFFWERISEKQELLQSAHGRLVGVMRGDLVHGI